MGRGARSRPCGEHALLLLRPAVRHQAQGARQRSRRLRAVVRVPVQRGQAVPEGREALSPGQPPGPLAPPVAARPGAPGGFRVCHWNDALDRVVGEIRRIQAEHGNDAFAMLSGVSLTNEKSYLIGKFARLALHTANLDYNGRFCMVSAGAGNKKALGVDRAPNPWSDIPLADVVWVAGSNVAETFPITTSYIWRARDRGARLIVQDPRVVPLARTADLFLPVRPGTDSALFGAVLHVLIRRDWLDHEFIDAHTVGFDEAAAAVADMTPEWAADDHRRARGAHRTGRGMVGDVGDGDVAARPRASSSSRRASTTSSRRSTSGSRPASTASRDAACRRSRARATARAGASTATSATSSRQPRHHEPRTSCVHRVDMGVRGVRDPGQGHLGRGDHRGDPRGARSRACSRSVSTRSCRRPTPTSPRSARQARVLRGDRLLPVGVRHTTPTSSCRVRCTRRTKARRRAVRAASSRSTRAVDPPGEARRDWEILCDIAERSARAVLPVPNTEEIFDELRLRVGRRHRRLQGRDLEADRGRDGPLLAVPEAGIRERRACSRAGSSSTPTARRASTPCRSASPPRSSTTSTRSGSPPGAS